MSRWVEEFKAHAFQETWSQIKEAIDEAQVDDETVATSVLELGRLVKVIAFVDKIIKGLDPELIPPGTWDQFQKQATPCLSEIRTFNNSRAIAHLANANAHVDNLLTYVRPYMVAEGIAAKAMQAAALEYSKVVERISTDSVSTAYDMAKRASEAAEETERIRDAALDQKNDVGNYHDDIFRDDSEEPGIKHQIENFVNSTEDIFGRMQTLQVEVFVGDESEPAIKSAIADAREDIEKQNIEIDALLLLIRPRIDDLESFHTKIYGNEVEEKNEDGEKAREGGLSKEFNGLIQKMNQFAGTQKAKYTALTEQIEGLLPGATSAGLATAYKDMKDSFDNYITRYTRIFYFAIASLLGISAFVAVESWGGDNGLTFVQLKAWEDVARAVLNKLPFYVPIIWLGYFASHRRSEAQRLQQEYAHKEALAKSYDNFKKQLLELDADDKEMQKLFIMKTVDAIAFNASSTLDGKHGNKIPSHDLADKIAERVGKKIAKLPGKTS